MDDDITSAVAETVALSAKEVSLTPSLTPVITLSTLSLTPPLTPPPLTSQKAFSTLRLPAILGAVTDRHAAQLPASPTGGSSARTPQQGQNKYNHGKGLRSKSKNYMSKACLKP